MEPVSPSEQEAGRTGLVLDPDTELVGDIGALVASGQRQMVLNIVADLHPADIAQLLTHLSRREAKELFGWLSPEVAGTVLAELDDDYRADLLEEVPHDRIAEVLDELETDDAADILADLPDHVAQRVLPSLEDAHHVGALLSYDEESAGGIMAVEYVAVHPDWTVARATEEVRRNAEAVENVYVVFVVDGEHRLVGFVSLKRLLLSRASALIADIMNPDVVSAHTDTDQEDVARIMERYDLVSLPVVDAENRLVGRVTIDDVVDVIREEAEEDIQRMSGVAGGEEPTDSAWRVTRGRLPWLLLGITGAGIAAAVILHFEDTLAAATVLAGFIPIVAATAGNAGIQSSAIAVQGLASGEIWATDFGRRMAREVAVALMNGVAVAVFLGVCVLVLGTVLPADFPDGRRLALTVAAAISVVVVLATTIGASVPILLDKLGVDPAIATGPFITTSNDILGMIVYFLFAKAIYL
jgi:magnesium transporter